MTLSRAPIGSLMKAPLEKRKRPKTPVEKRPGKDKAYLVMVRQLPCAVPCRSSGRHIEAHHLKATGERGVAMKSSDKWAIPLCVFHHAEVERIGSRNEVRWFKERGIDCLTLASSLYANKHDLSAMHKVLIAHRAG